jgi:predicted nucleotidyltransferase
MKFGLKEKDLTLINEVFSAFTQLEEAVIYGSRAKGNFRPGSDIDLTLKGVEMNLDIMNKISLSLDNLMLPYIFDLSVYDHIRNPDLLEHISRVGIIFYAKTAKLSGLKTI